MNTIIFPPKLQIIVDASNRPTAKTVGEVQSALVRLRAKVLPSELARKELGSSTSDAIREFQERAGLRGARGELTGETVDRLNASIAHEFVANSKVRTQRLHDLLGRAGFKVNAAELKARTFGPSTQAALEAFQARAGLPQDGRITDDGVNRLREDALKARLSAKTQVAQVHRTLLRALNIAKLKDVRVEVAELRGRQIGASTQAAVRAVQQKYGLRPTGELDAATNEKLESIAASIPQPMSHLKPRTAAELKPIRRVARLNMTGTHVADVQSALAFLGHPIAESEFAAKTFGPTTRQAVISYQRARGLPISGHVTGGTLRRLNSEMRTANPDESFDQFPHRVKGSFRDELWRGVSGARVQVWEKRITGQGPMLAERTTGIEGFFDIPYAPPRNPTTNQIVEPFHLEIVVLEGTNQAISKLLFNPTQIAWVNFTKGSQPYRGTSEFQARSATVSAAVGPTPVSALVEKPGQRQITMASEAAGLAPDDVMRLVLAHRVSGQLQRPAIGPEACYAYIAQNLPPNLPDDLLASTEDWTLIDNLVDRVANGLVFMEASLQALSFDNAVTLNLMPIAVGLSKAQVLAALADLQQVFTLEKPILIGNGSLKTLLAASTVPPANHAAVAGAFLQHRSLGPELWADLAARPQEVGGPSALTDLRTTVEVGHVTKNFDPMLRLVKRKIADPAVPLLKSSRDVAKLTQSEWAALIIENGSQVPAGTDGQTAADRVQTYAATLVSQSEQLFPAVALAATVARSATSPLPHLAAVQKLLDDHPDFDLRTMNVDSFAKQQAVSIDADTLTETRVLQRVHRLAPKASVGRALLDKKIHNSSQIIAMGRERFAAMMEGSAIDRRTAMTTFGIAEYQYAQVLQRIADYRFDLHRADPRSIVSHTYARDEMPAELSGLPNLDTLFGSLDFCACAHCQSVYGPAAYLADVLRFLNSHDSEVANKKVLDLLFERRPDIGNIKLNCDNTDIPLPYVDLVCEVLENAVAAPNPAPNFSFQTTRTRAELRAFPEHVREPAYEKLRAADYPMHVAFDLWQEESRTFLQHLGVPRWELMEAFQRPVTGTGVSPSDLTISGEYWGMSTHETDLVVTRNNTAARQAAFWGFSSAVVPTEMSVADFLRRTLLDYEQLLDLLSVRWLNPPAGPNPMVVERPDATCDTDRQKVVGLTVDRLADMHRFLRLWRRTGWAMWELDVLLRASAVGNAAIDGTAVVRLKQFKQVQRKLGLTVEQTLVLYGDIHTETRVKADQPQRQVPSHYANLFQNPVVTNPVNPAFALPLAGGALLSAHRSTLLAAFAVTEPDLVLLLARIGSDALTVPNLSRLTRYAILAQALKLPVKDLLTLEALSGVANIFATPKDTLDFIKSVDWVAASGLSIDELDYVLTRRPESPHGIREEVITEHIEGLREAIRGSEASLPDGAIVSHVASTFALTPDRSQLLVTRLQITGVTLLARLSHPDLMARDAAGAFLRAITTANFPEIFDAYRLLHKVSLLLARQKMETDTLDWLLQNSAAFDLLGPGILPVTAAPAAPLFPNWLNLVKWLYFEKLYPQPEGASLRQTFDSARLPATPVATIKLAIVALTQWKPKDLDDLATGLAIQHGGATSDYARIETYLRLHACFGHVKRLGAGTARLLAWSNRDDNTNEAQKTIAQEIRQVAKSKYGDTVWLDKVTPLQEALREKKRDALIGYLVATSLRTVNPEIVMSGKKYANVAYWQNADDLLKYFLIDVQMAPCQLTSRIKQAISSTQMFVQRCLLGLEQPFIEVSRAQQQDVASANSWKQWYWMKSYRLWEANRKVFLYPENWIEPELRDDKSPFFEELESEILQNDITDENVESAFLHYVLKVHEVSRLDITGAYHELDDTDPGDNLPPDINLLHVVGRTRSHPATYYYRRFDLNYAEWTAWEKVDLDIQSDQVIPVVYNRKLHLFWLEFVEKPQKVKKQPPAKASDSPTNTPETPNQLEVQLAWSARKDSGWTARRVSHQRLIHPWQRPRSSYNLKPRYKSRENLLWLDLYISQSQQFNNTRFWDPYRNLQDFVTAFRFDEFARPWHSSSFVFDGDVVDVKMKALRGQYHVLDAGGIATDLLTQTDSFTYVRDNFGDAGRVVNRLTGGYEVAPRIPLPNEMHFENTRLVNNKRTLNPSRANVFENGSTRTLLNGARSPFEIVFSQHRVAFDTAAGGPTPFFYQDNFRGFFIRPEWQEVLTGYNQTLQTYFYNFYPFYHPYTALFMRELNRSGIDGLLNRRIQTTPQHYYPGNSFNFNGYAPAAMTVPDKTATHDIVDFERYGAYASYNWEIFFHAPLLIACRLSANQRFAEAMRWFHYIFDPTNTESPDVPQRYWITRPFFEQNSEAYRRQRIEVLLKNIELHEDELRAWKNNPFKPHLIARYRPVAYQKTVVMKYIDNLIAWGDQLFRRDTIEAINEATTLYVLAYELLGRRPVKVPNVERQDRSYNELAVNDGLDPFGNKQVDVLMENFTGTPVRVTRTPSGTEPLPSLNVFYFGIPNNDRLLAYWDTVEDRLFKIRHCMNIAGVVRQLPLFEPPIDPALLVKAAAAGVDLSSVLADVTAAPGPYRFQRLSQKSLELCSEVRALGDKLLSALEKSDAEGLSLLRSVHEVRMNQAVRQVRKQQIEEATHSWAGLEKTKETVEQKRAYYESREFMNAGEIVAVTLGGVSAAAQTAIAVGYALAGGLALIPRFTAGVSGFGGSPEVTADPVDGLKFSKAAEAAVATLAAIATAADKIGSLASTVAGYQRRQDDWTFQAQQAAAEIAQLNKQIAAAQVRAAIAERELENQELQIEQSQAADEYMRSKYTNQQLYDWQIRRVASIYFQCYQLAYDMAKQAEKCFQFEIGDPAATYVQFGYWDSLKKGLLAGEQLANDIHRLEAAYLEGSIRDLEITKQISLAQFLPLSVMALKEAGACTVVLPEWLYDLDYPGHYRRRLKSVSVSIPCVVGPYTSVNATLSLTNHGIRMSTAVAAGYGDPLAAADTRFYKSPVPVTAIATSHAQNDAGVFELNFSDEKFFPFEGAGAVSEWRIELPRENNQFDFATISDVILHVRYTSRQSGDQALINAAKVQLATILPSSGLRLFELNQEFSAAWQRFLRPAAGADQLLTFTIGLEHLPFYARGKSTITLTKVDLIADGMEKGNFDVRLKIPGATATNEVMTPAGAFGNRQHLAKTGFAANVPVLGEWQLQIKKAAGTDFKSLGLNDINDAYLVLGFKTS
jgi:peptidoglycan hydrolase-like protein with peptidoglycan-binding domain